MKGEKLDCPCCGQRVALYAHRINRTMDAQLAELCRHGGWMHTRELERDVSNSDRDFAKMRMRFFGLVEGDGYASWRATQAGRDFVAGRTTVPAVVYVFDNEPKAFSVERVTFAQCQGQPFDLLDVLDGTQNLDGRCA